MDVERFGGSPIGDLRRITGVDGRTGRSYEHVAYVPHPLSVEPDLQGATWRDVADARAALARLDQAARQVVNPALLRRPTLRREAQSTSALEGTFAAIDDVLAADSASLDPDDRALVEVLNYVDAAEYAFESLAQAGVVTLRMIEDAHRFLVVGTDSETADAGRIRRCQVAIGTSGGTIELARFVPMPPGPELDSAVRDLIDWMSGETKERDPLVAAALAHYQFETLHPFNDGNGRLGRLLIVLQMMTSGLLSEPLLSVSPWLESRRTTYQDLLARVSESGSWDEWVRFFARAVRESADDTGERINALLDVQDDYVDRLQSSGYRGGVARDIVDVLIGNPIVRVQSLAKAFGKTPAGISNALAKLVELGILSGPHGSYNKRYVASEVRAVITAPPGAVVGRMPKR